MPTSKKSPAPDVADPGSADWLSSASWYASPKLSPEAERRLRSDLDAKIATGSRAGLWICIVTFIAFGFLDPQLLAGSLAWPVKARGIMVATFAALLLVQRWPSVQRHVRLHAWLSGYWAGFCTVWVTALVGGLHSDYHYSLLLVFLAMSVLIPLAPGPFMALVAAIIVTFNLANFVGDGLGPWHMVLVANLGFLIGGAITTISAALTHAARRREMVHKEALEKASDELARNVDKLQELHRLKSQFFANISHELRTPLTLILEPVRNLLRAGAPAEMRPMLQAMERSGQRLLRQVNMLLDLSRFEAGRREVVQADSSLADLLREQVAIVRPLTDARALEVRLGDLSAIEGAFTHRSSAETIVANLLSNALKFTPRGSITITAGRAGDEVWFEVADTGIGIPADQLDLVFDRFHQVQGHAAREAEGTGLGLALVKELATSLGGSVTAESQLGVGTQFRVTLPWVDRASAAPVADDDADTRRNLQRILLADVQVPRAITADRVVIGPAQAPLIMVVEDNDDLRDFLAQSLAAHYRVTTANNGEDALEVLRGETPRLIVSDVMMPRMDGIELVRRVREDARLRAVPVVFLTARVDTESVIAGLHGGAIDYISKPFDVRELEARIESLLRFAQLSGSLAERESRLIAVGQMTSSIAHDLRNPLTAISLCAQLALRVAAREPMAQGIQRDLKLISESVAKARGLIDDVVTFAAAGNLVLARRSCYFHDLLLRSRDANETALHDAGITVDVTFPPEPLTAEIDPERFARIIDNLLSNAIDALVADGPPPGERRILIAARDTGADIELKVCNNGPPIPAELVPRIFDAFVTHGKSSGTGLGLTIVLNLVRAHGGGIHVEPGDADTGPCFVLTFPKQDPPALQSSTEPMSTTTTGQLSVG